MSSATETASLGDFGARQVATKDANTTSFELQRDQLAGAFAALHAAGFETNTFVTAVDRFPEEPRFEVCWQFLCLNGGDRVRLRVAVPEDDARVPSCTAHWPGAAFSERECFDMFGIEFEGNADLRRLLMPEAYEHFPLRKDFPHQGIEPDKLYRAWDRERRQEWDAKENRS